MDSTLVPTDRATQQSHNSSFHNDNSDHISPLTEIQEENDTDNSSETSEISESQSIDINPTNINIHENSESSSET